MTAVVPQVSEITADIRRWCREECDNMDSRMGADSYAIMLADNTAVLSVNVFSSTRGSRAFASFRENVGTPRAPGHAISWYSPSANLVCNFFFCHLCNIVTWSRTTASSICQEHFTDIAVWSSVDCL